jgi:hypothetical protein
MTTFYRPDLYLIESEPEIIRGYGDLLYIVRNENRKFKIKDFIIEFKYVSISEIGKKVSKIREVKEEALLENKVVTDKILEAKNQLRGYEKSLKAKYPSLYFHKYVLLGIGFEKVLGIDLSN